MCLEVIHPTLDVIYSLDSRNNLLMKRETRPEMTVRRIILRS